MSVANALKVLLFVAACFSPFSHAQSPSAVFTFAFKASTRADRIASARAMLAHVEYVASVLPTMRPSEKEWLAAEKAAIAGLKSTALVMERSIQLHKTVENQHAELDHRLTNLREALGCIIGSTVPPRREVFCWAVASYHFGYEDLTYAVGKLRQAGRLPRVNLASGGEGPVDDDDTLQLVYRMGARRIQEEIVLPYLRGDLK